MLLQWKKIDNVRWALTQPLSSAAPLSFVWSHPGPRYSDGYIRLSNKLYTFTFHGQFDQEWRDQLQAIAEEDLTSIE